MTLLVKCSRKPDAGYITAEATEALLKVAKNQAKISSRDSDPADDPEIKGNRPETREF